MHEKVYQLWFDVGIKRYTTHQKKQQVLTKLWFDVGIKRYTTSCAGSCADKELWFDVGIKRYTTRNKLLRSYYSCGLM